MTVYRNDGLRILTDWRFAIIQVKGTVFFSVHAMKAERGRSVALLLLHLGTRWT